MYPVLGNHEFKGCKEANCLALWWQTFSQESGRRWYTVMFGSRPQFIALDSESSLLPASEQGRWLPRQLEGLSASVRFAVFLLHHPPMTDYMLGPRANEVALAKQLGAAAAGSRARFVVCAVHVHNYERFLHDDIVFLVPVVGEVNPSL